MNRIYIIHRALAAVNIAALLTGLALGGSVGISLNTIMLVILISVLRVKFWLDDEAYFEDVDKGKLPRGLPFAFGFGFAVISWIVWIFAALFVKQLETASLLMAFFFIPSTAWIIASMVKQGAYAEQVPWLFFNVFYILGFVSIFARQGTWNPFAATFNNFTTGVLVGLLVVFLFDMVVTRILEQRRRREPTG